MNEPSLSRAADADETEESNEDSRSATISKLPNPQPAQWAAATSPSRESSKLAQSPPVAHESAGSESLASTKNRQAPKEHDRLGRVRKKSEEGKRIRLPGKRSSKEADIPVGIAIAWQRQVTTATTDPSTVPVPAIVPAPSALSSATVMQSTPVRGKRSTSSPKARVGASLSPDRRGSPHLSVPSERPRESPKSPNRSHSRLAAGSPRGTSMAGNSHPVSTSSSEHHPVIPVSTSTATSSSNSGNATSGYAYNYSNGYGLNSRGSPYADWPAQLMPHQLSQSYNAAATAYLQQQQLSALSNSLQTQMQLQLTNNPYAYNLSNYMYGAYPADSLLQYEQFLRQQQHQDQLEAQQRRLIDYDLHHRASPAIQADMARLQALSSPRISIPSPSPGGTTGSGVFSQQSHSWASDLYHHHHMTLTSSTATLSPRSLASSTPSPITIHDSHNYRKCGTPNSLPSKHLHMAGRDDKLCSPISLVKHGRTPSLATLVEETVQGPEDLTEARKHHDFARPESLIEKRDNESVCLLTQEKKGEKRRKRVKGEKKGEKVEKKRNNGEKKGVKTEKKMEGRSVGSKRKHDCDGTVKIDVPEPDQSKETELAEKGLARNPFLADVMESHPKYFKPLEVSRETNYANSNNNYASNPFLGKDLIPPRDFKQAGAGNFGAPQTSSYDDISCDSDTVVMSGTVKTEPNVNVSISEFSRSPNTGLVHTFPKIVISAEESHLNLLATVAQEIGPYISMNTTQRPRRFENYNNCIQLQPIPDTNNSTVLDMNPVEIKLETEPPVETQFPENLDNLNLGLPNPEIPHESSAVPFQLKIPQVLPRPVKQKIPKKLKLEGEKKVKDKARILKPKKEPKTKDANSTKPKALKIHHKAESKPKIKSINIKKPENGTVVAHPIPVPIQLVAPHQEEPSKDLRIYDFDFEDPKPSLEPFSVNRPHLSSSAKHTQQLPEKHKMSKPKNDLSIQNSLTRGPTTIQAKEKKPHALKPKAMPPASLTKSPLKPRPVSTVKPMKDINYVSAPLRATQDLAKEPNLSVTPLQPVFDPATSVLPVFESPTLTKPPTASLSNHFLNTLNTDSNGSSNTEDSLSSSTAWIANPAYAVTAVKSGPESDTESLRPKRQRRRMAKPSKLTVEADKAQHSNDKSILEIKTQLSSFVHFSAAARKSTTPHQNHIKPCLKAEPIVRPITEADLSSCDSLDLDIQTQPKLPISSDSGQVELGGSERTAKGTGPGSDRLKIRKPSIDMNIFSRRAKSTDVETSVEKRSKEKAQEEAWNEDVVITGVEEMVDEMRILTEIQGLFYTGKLNALHPPDVYGVTLDNERGAPPHIIFSAEEVLEKCIREAKPWKSTQLPHGLRICAYWSPMYSGLYPGKVSTDYDTISDLVPVEFDDGDTGVIKIEEIRLLAPNHPIREYDPNPLLTLEKKHRKRRHSSAAGSQTGCTGEHEDADCGEAYCAKIAKLDEDDEEEDYSQTHKYKYWAWHGHGSKLPKTKKNRHKEFFNGIQRGDEVISVGDSAIFISHERNERPFLGRVEKFWEKKGHKVVNVRWFYHPEEVKVKSGKRLQGLKYPGALFESPHIDENDVQTIAKKCEVLPYEEFKEKYGAGFPSKPGKGQKKSHLKGIYYLAGYYDPYTFKLKMKDLK